MWMSEVKTLGAYAPYRASLYVIYDFCNQTRSYLIVSNHIIYGIGPPYKVIIYFMWPNALKKLIKLFFLWVLNFYDSFT